MCADGFAISSAGPILAMLGCVRGRKGRFEGGTGAVRSRRVEYWNDEGPNLPEGRAGARDGALPGELHGAREIPLDEEGSDDFDDRPSARRPKGGRCPLSRRAVFAGAGALAVVGLAAWGVPTVLEVLSRDIGPDGAARGGGASAPGAEGTSASAGEAGPRSPVRLGASTLHEQDGLRVLVYDEGRTTASGDGRVGFSAVGDNLLNENLLALADSWTGSVGDGTYDFAPFYAQVESAVRNGCDVSFISQETVLGGTESFDYMGYPSYNTPDAVADAVVAAGWRVVNLWTNHTYDIWTDGIGHALGVWGAHEGVLTCGSYASEEDRRTVRAFECNGIRVAVLSYCYGQNGYEPSDLPNDYYAVPIDESLIREDVARARGAADAVLVYMHWGEEYVHDPSDEQRHYAQVCADAGVDVVIGSHAHVVQPVEWIVRSGGGRMLCAYGLGDFLSGYHDNPKTVLSGMLRFDFARVEGERALGRDDVGPGGIAVENPVWRPLVEHMEGASDAVRFVKGYTDEEAVRNELLAGLADPRQWLVDTTRSVVGPAVSVEA